MCISRSLRWGLLGSAPVSLASRAPGLLIDSSLLWIRASELNKKRHFKVTWLGKHVFINTVCTLPEAVLCFPAPRRLREPLLGLRCSGRVLLGPPQGK